MYVVLEHRFYGKSFPTDTLATPNLALLTSQQGSSPSSFLSSSVLSLPLHQLLLMLPIFWRLSKTKWDLLLIILSFMDVLFVFLLHSSLISLSSLFLFSLLFFLSFFFFFFFFFLFPVSVFSFSVSIFPFLPLFSISLVLTQSYL